MAVRERLHLVPQRWYGWQMLPGYDGARNVPYFSPIRMIGVSPRKTGRGIVGLSFWNQFYAEGVQDFHLEVRILKHESHYLIADLLTDESPTSSPTNRSHPADPR